jgi:phosphoglycerol transferase
MVSGKAAKAPGCVAPATDTPTNASESRARSPSDSLNESKPLSFAHAKGLMVYSLAALVCFAITVWGFHLWDHDLRVPIAYADGDAAFNQMQIKMALDTGWYLESNSLGAPFGMNTYDFPQFETVHVLIAKLIALANPNPAVVINVLCLTQFVLITLCSVIVFRALHFSSRIAIAASLLYAFSPYHWWRWPDVYLAGYFLVPLMVLVVLWVYQDRNILFSHDEGDHQGARHFFGARTLAAVAIAILIASGGVYYAFFGCFFLLVSGMGSAISQHRLRPLANAGALVLVICVAGLANLSPNLIHWLRQGYDPQVSQRAPSESETNGLKIAQMVLPVAYHRLGLLAALRGKYNETAPLVNENEAATLGIVGTLGFLMIAWRLVFVGRLSSREPTLDDAVCLLTLAGFFLATVGGFGTILSYLGFDWIRGYNRIVVYLAFFALIMVATMIERLAQKYFPPGKRRLTLYGVLAVLFPLAILDQTQRPYGSAYEETLASVRESFWSDDEFVKRMESELPDGSMVFQLPYLPFPEGGTVQQMMDYAHFRSYLHSTTLRWSYGSVKGSPADAWQSQVASQPPDDMVRTLSLAGFNGIYVDRFGYEDRGAALEQALTALLGADPIVSRDERFWFISMEDYNQRLRQECTEDERQEQLDGA